MTPRSKMTEAEATAEFQRRTPPRSTAKDIAVIGMACRVAGADSPTELWENLISSKDVQRRITRFNIDGFYHPKGGPLKGLTNVDRAYMLDDDVVDKFDNTFFHVTPVEATAMDPQQCMLLEVSYEAVENAGIPLELFTGTDTAVFTGIEGSDYHTVLARDLDLTPKYIVTGTAGCMAANRLSYFYDLSGPSMSVDTACSSSMAAVHQAVRTLQHGDSSMALVCGANLIFNPDSFVSMTELGFLSPSGTCRSFDAVAEGYGRGEGIGVILLKPFQQALDDGDPIRAVIMGTRLNQDGRTQGITLPSAGAQQRNMGYLYSDLAIDSSSIQYLEAHGTGTAAGDPLEMQAVNAIFAGKPLIVGSVKSSTGHCEAASALIGLIKTILCLENGQIPAQMHFNRPNPRIDFTNLTVPTRTLEWPLTNCGPRRAAINTFGAGGTNGHAVLEAYNAPSSNEALPQRPWFFKVSAADEVSLQALSNEYAAYVAVCKPDLRDLAHTLLAHRSSLRYTRFMVASSHDELHAQLRPDATPTLVKSRDTAGQLLFVFTGQGAQWAQMGRSLLGQSPLVRSVLEECEDALKQLPNGPSWSLIEELCKPPEESNVNEAEYAQPLCTALQIGLVSLLRSWDVRPGAVVGHSSGEIAAAFAAGIISLRVAIITAYYRGLLFAGSSGWPLIASRGSMCAVGASEDECMSLEESSKGLVQLAAINSPRSCTLSGNRQAIQDVVNVCAKKGQFCRLMKVDRAYHSHHMLGVAQLYERYLIEAGIGRSKNTPHCTMFSSVTGAALGAHEYFPLYWARNLTSTVRFASAMEECFRKQPDINGIVEIGPHTALRGPIQEILDSTGRNSVNYFSTCKRDTDDFQAILETTGRMIVAGVRLNLRAVNATEVMRQGIWTSQYGKVLTNLPSYRWNHSSSFWSESRVSRNIRFRAFPRHELLGSRCSDDIPPQACWRNHLNPTEIDWLRGIESDQLCETAPAIYVLMAVEAARQLTPHDFREFSAVRMTNVDILNSSALKTGIQRADTVETRLICRKNGQSTQIAFEIHCVDDSIADQWVLCAKGKIEFIPHAPPKSLNGRLGAADDPILIQKAQTCYPHVITDTEGLRMSNGMVQGTTTAQSTSWQLYPIHPQSLAWVLSLGPTSLLGSGIPVNYRVVSLDTLHLPVTPSSATAASFDIRTSLTRAGGAKSTISVDCDGYRRLAGEVFYEATDPVPLKPVTSSLFFKPLCLPDITKHMNQHAMSIERCLQLINRKWPMSDIRMRDIPAGAQERLMEILHNRQPWETSKFCTITMHGDAGSDIDDERTRIVKETERDLPAHIMFTVKIDVANPIHDYLQPFGLACVQLPKKEAEQCLADSFDYVCEVTGLEDNPWTLWRLKRTGSASLQKRNSVIFSPRNFPLMKGLNVPLELEKIQKFVARHDLERLEAVVIDNPAKSIITAWPGRDLIPWLQHLIKHAESLLWVTLHTSSSPSVDVAGTLLRTLQAEQPSLKVCWLVVDDAQTVNTSILQEIEAARMSMQQGDNEIRLQSDGKETKITRYLPDHDLSLATGVSVPYQVRDPVYHPPTNLAAANGAYIIIGGLGGLGRFVCSWLIEQGATSLYAISRSGISSPEARRLHDTLILTPRVQFQAIQADACDREAMTSVFKYIRGKEAIKGVINMAMVLGDAPLASMTGEQWDRALRVKIDSSWLLHELTSAADDGLEHFLLFSSIASVLGNRGQGGYNVGNAFLNALAVWRRKQGRVGVSVALGAMTDIGVLAELPDWDPEMTKKNLARSGLERLTAPHLAKILEAAFRKAGRQREGKESVPEDALIVTGLEMFEKEADGSLVGKGRSRGERLFWTELPEFSHLSAYRPPPSRGAADKDVPLKERVGRVVAKGDGQALKMMVEEGILGFLSTSLGFGRAAIDPGRSMGTYGLDSLNAVNCQFWCFRELGVDVSIAEIFEAKSIESFAGMVSGRIEARMGMVGGVGEGS